MEDLIRYYTIRIEAAHLRKGHKTLLNARVTKAKATLLAYLMQIGIHCFGMRNPRTIQRSLKEDWKIYGAWTAHSLEQMKKQPWFDEKPEVQ